MDTRPVPGADRRRLRARPVATCHLMSALTPVRALSHKSGRFLGPRDQRNRLDIVAPRCLGKTTGGCAMKLVATIACALALAGWATHADDIAAAYV